MTAHPARSLADCLEQVEAGAPQARALAAAPQTARAELAALVELAQAVRALPPRAPRTLFRASVQAELARLEAERHPRVRAAGASLSIPLPRRLPMGFASVLAAAVGLILVGTVAASAGSRPGDRLYPVKRFVQRVWPAFGDQQPAPSDATVRGSARAKSDAHHDPAPIARRERPDLHVASNGTTVGIAHPSSDQSRPNAPSPVAAGGPDDPALGPLPLAGVPDRSATATPGPARPALEPSVKADHPPARHGPTPTPAATMVADFPTATQMPEPMTPTLAPGDLAISGHVKQVDGSPGGLALAGVEVRLHRFDVPPACQAGAGPAITLTVTDALGAYAFVDLPAGTYAVAATRPLDPGDPACLPTRWHTRNGPAVADFCDALPSLFKLDGETPGRAWTNINVLYEVDARCP